MRHISRHLGGIAAALGLAMCVPAQGQLLTLSDWLTHRGSPQRVGGNSDAGILPDQSNTADQTKWPQLAPAWVYPASRDMPAEMVVDNTTLASASLFPTKGGALSTWDNRDYPAVQSDGTIGRLFGVQGTWVYPSVSSRMSGAWPLSDFADSKVGDYVYTDAVHSSALADIGTDTLATLPNLSAGDTTANAVIYKQVDDSLKAATGFARWTFGTNYPAGTLQGTVDVGSDATRCKLAPNQRYAVFIRFPASGTLDNSAVARPNTQHVMVRVSWGADVNDPVTSRIFMLDFSQTGGYWQRVRTDSSDDRFFPYGLKDPTKAFDPHTNPYCPITVTLYNVTPDDQPNLSGVNSIIVADAVRLVPEALRGDIHAPAASAVFPPNAKSNAIYTQYYQFTYYGRDETSGPAVLFPTATSYSSVVGSTGITLDPTAAYNKTTNPLIYDPTRSIRSAVFYCMQDYFDKVTPARNRYGQLRWRYPAWTQPVISTTIDDTPPPQDPNGQFFSTAGFSQLADVTQQPFGVGYEWTFGKATADQSATWKSTVKATADANGTYGTYTVLVWIPGGDITGTIHFTTKAHYQIYTDVGVLDYYLDQRNTAVNAQGTPLTCNGMWRTLATGIRFPGNVAKVVLDNAVPAADEAASRVVVADAIQFVGESHSSSSVVASPLLARVKWPSGKVRSVVYYGTTDGHLWALDAIGPDQDANGAPIFPAVNTGDTQATTSTLTTPYWVYPSVSNPGLVPTNPLPPAADRLTDGALTGLKDDPNWQPDAQNNVPAQGIDGDLQGPVSNLTPNYTTKAPDLGAFYSSPTLVETAVQNPDLSYTYTQYVVAGNSNGRIYAFDPAGRTLNGEPYAVTFAIRDYPGVPGTTRRLMTWPTIPRDKWLRKGGLQNGGNFSQYTDDSLGSQAEFVASPTANKTSAAIDPSTGASASNLVLGCVANYASTGTGHVYAIDMATLDPHQRISNPNNNGVALWQFPEADAKGVDPIVQPGALTDDSRFVFSAGGRVYCIATPPATATIGGKTVLQPEWTYPYASAPGDPSETRPNDQQPNDNSFTAPVYRTGISGINSGNAVAYVANQDGRVYAFDATPTGNPVAGPSVLFTSRSRGTTRASAIFINSIPPQAVFSTSTATPPTPSVPVTNGVAKPGILLPDDAGGMVAYSVLDSGYIMWRLFDSGTGRVPVTQKDSSDNLVTTAVATSTAYRGADATAANGWVYNGDEGNQDLGEFNGQMRAYADATVTGGMSTPGEPYYPPGGDANGSCDLRMVELWNAVEDDAATPYQYFGSTDPTKWVSPYDSWKGGKRRPDNLTPPGMVVYEWGDDIVLAAWGAYTGNILPTVTFTLQGGSQTVAPVTVGAVRDRRWDSGGLTIAGIGAAQGWVAKATFPFRKPSDANDQAPGRKYTVQVRAQLSAAGGAIYTTNQLTPGEAYVTKTSPNPPSGQDENAPVVGTARLMAIAHPLAISTVGVPSSGGGGNTLGWYTAVNGTSYKELMANGNRLSTITGSTLALDSKAKPLTAPVGFLPHGASGPYLGGAGQKLLLIADRSSLWKRNDPLGNVRVERKALEWGWNSDDSSLSTLQRKTGNVMNPLPWETFPVNYPNTSADYPDMDLSRTSLRVGSVDMSRSGVTLPLPAITRDSSNQVTGKTLREQPIDMTVAIPRYQPANINSWFVDINQEKHSGLAGPPLATIQSPSAGYYGSIAVYVASGSTRYRGTAFRAQQQSAGNAAREDVYREFAVGVGVPPDISLRTEEQTIDLGNESHGLGFAPGVPFSPSGIGPYANSNVQNPYKSFFAPFTIRNQGNVNLVNLRVAKVMGDESTKNTPAFWLAMKSDQVDPIVALLGGGILWERPYNTIGSPAVGNLGVVSSLDHSRRGGLYDLETSYSSAPYGASELWPFSSGNPYVVSGNPLAWATGTDARPTVTKPRPGDVSPTTMSIPGVAYGDPLNFLSGRDSKPKIGVAIPVGTPVGTYSAKAYVFEDAYPQQWTDYAGQTGGALAGYTSAQGGFDDGILNQRYDPSTLLPVGTPSESVVQNPFTLKVTVREARLTNEEAGTVQVPGPDIGNFWQIDARNGAAPLGANFAPSAIRDGASGDLLLYWASNREWTGSSWVAPSIQDTPWSLFYTQLNGVSTAAGLYDWRFENGRTRWWNPIPNNQSYPDITLSSQWFPSAAVANQPWLPAVAGAIVPSGLPNLPLVRHGGPVVTQDESNPKKTWLFWTGYAYKTAGTGGTEYNIDSRTFYAQVARGNGGAWAPVAMSPSAGPLSFKNDAQLAKLSTKPLLMVDQGGTPRNYLFWHGNGAGGSRLFYNLANGNLASITPASWQDDVALATPGGLQGVSDPTPVRRKVWWDSRVTSRWDTDTTTVPGVTFQRYITPYDVDPSLPQLGSAPLVDAIDLVYTGVAPRRKRPETFLTRYQVLGSGRLQVMALPAVENEVVVRDGTTNTWTARDLAWVYRGSNGYVDSKGNPWIMVRVNGQPANTATGISYDNTTGRILYNLAALTLRDGRQLAGQISVDPQLGTVTFIDVAPGLADSVTVSYIPQTMRVNASRSEPTVIQVPTGFGDELGVQPRPYVVGAGANTQPSAFIDTYPNPRWVQNSDAFFRANGSQTQSAGETQTARLWTIYRKTGTSASAAALYYSARRLMVRLPRGVVRTLSNSGSYTIAGNIQVAGNHGPYEVDWIRGRVYFTEADEGNVVGITFNYGRDTTTGNMQTMPPGAYRVSWGDEISVGSLAVGNPLGQGTDQTTSEVIVPMQAALNEGQVSAFRDPVQAKVWLFWSSTRSGSTDLYYMAISPQFYPQPAN